MKRRRFKLRKGLTTTVAAIALLSAAHAAPVHAADDTTKQQSAHNGTAQHKIKEAEASTVSQIDEVAWHTSNAQTSGEGETVTVGTTISAEHEANGSLTKTEEKKDTSTSTETTDTVIKEETSTDEAGNTITSTTTKTDTTTTTTETGSGTISGSTDGGKTDEDSDSVKEELKDIDWSGVQNGTVTSAGDYTIRKNDDGSFTFVKESSSETEVSAEELEKIFGAGYTRNEDGTLSYTDTDGSKVTVTITGNKVTVKKTTSADVTIKNEVVSGENFDNKDFDLSNDEKYADFKEILGKLSEDGTKFDGKDAVTVKNPDGTIQSITVGNTVYNFSYTYGDATYTEVDLSTKSNEEIAKMLGEGYSVKDGKLMKGDQEITLDEAKSIIKKISTQIKVTETTTDAGTSGTIDKVEGVHVSNDGNTLTIGGVTISKNQDGKFVGADGKVYTVTETAMTTEEILAKLQENGHTEYKIVDGKIVDGNGTVVDLSKVETKKWSVSYTESKDLAFDVPGYGFDKIDGKFNELDDVYNAIFSQITGGTYTDGKADHITASDGTKLDIGYSDDGMTVTITGTKTIEASLSMKEIAEKLGEGYTYRATDDKIYDASGNEVVIEQKNGVLTYTTKITITAKTKEETVITPANPDDSASKPGATVDIPSAGVLNGDKEYKQGDTYTDSNGNVWTFVSGTVTAKYRTEYEKVTKYDPYWGPYTEWREIQVFDGYEYSDVVWKDASGTFWNGNNRLNFFVRLDGNMADYETAGSPPKSEYTTSVGSGVLGSKDDKYPTYGKDSWIYQDVVDNRYNNPDQKDVGSVISSIIDADTNNNVNYGKDGEKSNGYAIDHAPTDESVFEKLFNSSYNSGNKIYYYKAEKDENGKDVRKQYELTKEIYEANKKDFSIYWYVLKKENDGFHIDGCVVYNPAPSVSETVTVKKWYEIDQSSVSTSTDGSIHGSVSASRNDAASGSSISGSYESADRVTNNQYTGFGYSYSGSIDYTTSKVDDVIYGNISTSVTNDIEIAYDYIKTTVSTSSSTETKTEISETPAVPDPDPVDPGFSVDPTPDPGNTGEGGNGGGENIGGGDNGSETVPVTPTPAPVTPDTSDGAENSPSDDSSTVIIGDETTPLNPSPVVTPNDNVSIDDEEVPLANPGTVEEMIEIDEEAVPLASIPQTGAAGSKTAAATGIMAGLAAFLFGKKKRKDK